MAARGWLDLGKFDARLARHAPCIFLEAGRNPGWWFVTDSDNMQLHRLRSELQRRGRFSAWAISPIGRMRRWRPASPQLLQVVVRPYRGLHYVHDYVAQVHQNPFTSFFPFQSLDAYAQPLELLLYVSCQRLCLAG